MKIKAWLVAFRLRTLPLALASIGMGSFLAASADSFRLEVLLLCALTTVLLQVLSNLANDYGDSIHGADSEGREGPSRSVQSGAISAQSMKNAMGIFSILSFMSGVALLWVSLESWVAFAVFVGLGVMAILAAITYTAGNKPYGYAGLGDLSVMTFFGWLGVLGTFYLHTLSFDWAYVLPASSCGFFATAVLNVNNIRDIPSDEKAGKKSIPVRLGREKARIYHWFLLIAGVVMALIYVVIDFRSLWQLSFLATLPLLWQNGKAISSLEKPKDLDPFLKQMALTTLLFVLTFGFGNL